MAEFNLDAHLLDIARVQANVDRLVKRRARLRAELADIDSEISATSGFEVAAKEWTALREVLESRIDELKAFL